MNKIIKDALVLFLITLISGVLLGSAYYITKTPIERQELEKKKQAYEKVLENAKEFEEMDITSIDNIAQIEAEYNVTIQGVANGIDESGNECGKAIYVNTHEGYGGDIIFIVGIDNTGTITGLEIVTISETANIGMKANEDLFKNQFAGKKGEKINYVSGATSNEDEITAISGATITTKAVTSGVNAAITLYNSLGGASNE